MKTIKSEAQIETFITTDGKIFYEKLGALNHEKALLLKDIENKIVSEFRTTAKYTYITDDNQEFKDRYKAQMHEVELTKKKSINQFVEWIQNETHKTRLIRLISVIENKSVKNVIYEPEHLVHRFIEEGSGKLNYYIKDIETLRYLLVGDTEYYDYTDHAYFLYDNAKDLKESILLYINENIKFRVFDLWREDFDCYYPLQVKVGGVLIEGIDQWI